MMAHSANETLHAEQYGAHTARRERRLLVLAGLFVLANHVALLMLREWPVRELWPVGLWAISALGGHLVLNRRLPRRDPVLFPVAMFLAGWGLNVIARLLPGFADRQAVWVAISVAALVTLTLTPRDLRWLRRYRYTWLIGGLVLLALTIAIGQNPASEVGPRLWIWVGFGRVYYQPSELLKILLVAFLASYLAEHYRYMRMDTWRLGGWSMPGPAFMGPMLLMWTLCVVILVWQRDLGAATLFFMVFMVMLYIASGQWQLLIGGFGLLVVAGAVAYRLFDVVRLRVDIWVDPWQTAGADAYQIVQSLMAISAGGVGGQGIGQGYPQIIPVAHSDFVFAAIAEEWGALGAFGVLLGVAILVVRGMRLAVRARQPFRVLLASGLSVVIAVQSLLITGGVLKLVPLTGVTLPFVSYGGSSLLTSFVIVGLLLMVSDHDN